jgi:hypothetical protein
MYVRNLLTSLPSNGRCLQNYYLATGLYATIYFHSGTPLSNGTIIGDVFGDTLVYSETPTPPIFGNLKEHFFILFVLAHRDLVYWREL